MTGFTRKEDAAAVILAGGSSLRMGRCKALLPDRSGRPLIQAIAEVLRSGFREVLVSANRPAMFEFLGLPVIADDEPGRGPLQGIASALSRARSERVFFIGCDQPLVDATLVLALLRAARGRDAAVPMTPAGYLEPTFAVYCRSLLPAVRKTLAQGENRIRRAFVGQDVAWLSLPAEDCIPDINRPEDYARWARRGEPGRPTGSR